jgi:hypothetical protein
VRRLAKPCGVGLLTEPVALRGKTQRPPALSRPIRNPPIPAKRSMKEKRPAGTPPDPAGWWGAAMTRRRMPIGRIGWMSLPCWLRQTVSRAGGGRDHRAAPGSRSEGDYRPFGQA